MIVTILMNNGSEFTCEVENKEYTSDALVEEIKITDYDSWISFGNVLFNIKNISTIKYEEETK